MLAPVALTQLLLPDAAPPRRRGAVHHLRRRRRGLRGLGRLRRGQGRAGAGLQRPGRRGEPRSGSGGSTPATCAPGCTSRPSPARTSPTGRCPRPWSPRSCRLHQRADAQRPVPRRRPDAGGAGHDGHADAADAARVAFTLPAELEAHEPPEARGTPRDDVALMVSRRAAGRDQPSRVRRPAGAAAARRPARGQHLGHAARRRCRWPATGLDRCTSPPRMPDGDWLVELRAARDADHGPVRRRRARPAARAARRGGAAPGRPVHRSGSGGPGCPPP